MNISRFLESSVFYKWANFKASVGFKLEYRHFYNKARNCVQTCILQSKVRKVLKIQLEWDSNETMTMNLESSVFYKCANFHVAAY